MWVRTMCANTEIRQNTHDNNNNPTENMNFSKCQNWHISRICFNDIKINVNVAIPHTVTISWLTRRPQHTQKFRNKMV